MARTKRRRARKAKGPIRHITVGHDAIDAGHKAIIECCRKIADCGTEAAWHQLQKLRSLLENHFHNEELLLKAAGSDLCECHARDHRLILALCDLAISENTKHAQSSQQMIVRNLIPKLREHIAYRDQLIALYLNTQEANARGRLN